MVQASVQEHPGQVKKTRKIEIWIPFLFCSYIYEKIQGGEGKNFAFFYSKFRVGEWNKWGENRICPRWVQSPLFKLECPPWNLHIFLMRKIKDSIPFINAQKYLELLYWPQRPLLDEFFLYNLFIWKAWAKHNLRPVNASWFWAQKRIYDNGGSLLLLLNLM